MSMFQEADFFYIPQILREPIESMKKHIKSTGSLKVDKLTPQELNAEVNEQRRFEEHSHTLRIPKIPKKHPSPSNNHNSQLAGKTNGVDLRFQDLVYNLINSSDRIAALVKEQDCGCSYSIYFEDRNKVVEQLDKIVSLSQKSNKRQTKQQRPSSKQDYLGRQLEAIKDNIDKAIKRKKRSFSESPIPQIQAIGKTRKQEYDLSILRYLLVQQINKGSTLKLQMSELKKQTEKIQSNFTYLEFLTFKSQQILSDNLMDNQKYTQFFLIEKEKANLVINSLKQTILYIQSQEKLSSLAVTHKIKEEAQSMVLAISQMRQKAFFLVKQKQQSIKRLEEEGANFDELKLKVSRLNREMGELAEQLDKKDEIIEYLKIQNTNIKDDLKGMEDMVRQTKQHYNSVADELYLTSQKLKILQSHLQTKEEQISDLLSEINSKNDELMIKMEQIQAKQEDYYALKEEYKKRQEENARIISTLHEEKKLMALQRQKKQNQLKQTQGKIRFLEEESFILQKKIESAFNEEQDYKFKISVLEEKIESLQLQNRQLYNDIKRSQQKGSKQPSIKQLERQCALLKQEINEHTKRIKLYQQQLSKMAIINDTSYFEKIISQNERIIAQLQYQLSEQTNRCIPPIIKENSQEIQKQKKQLEAHSKEFQAQNSPINSIEDLFLLKCNEENPEGSDRNNSKQRDILQNFIACMPTFDEKQESRSNRGFLDQLDISKGEQSCISVLSYYQIHITNQNLNRIDSHTAVTPKKIPKPKQSSVVQIIAALKEPSNYADFASQMQGKVSNLSQKSNEVEESKGYQSNIDERLSEASRNVNVDGQIENLDEVVLEVDEYKTPVKPSQLPDLLMSGIEKGSKDSRHKYSPMKNVDILQQIKAEQRFYGQIPIKQVVKSKTQDNRIQKSKGSILLEKTRGKFVSVKSCYDKDD